MVRELRKAVERAPVDATFRPVGDGVEVVPDKAGRAVDVPATAKALLAAAVSPGQRAADLVVRTAEAERTTADAQAMGIERRLSSYTTLYAGTPDRITNLQVAVSLLNGALVAPGGTFSFNDRVGERTTERGFRSAPVIIKDEYDEAVGGGVSQVATTVFNAAWEAGLKIAERNPHSLYISRYQLGRDATVNYPDLDLRFINDTPNWVLVGAASGGAGITVSIYGGGPERRVESGEGSMTETGPAPIRRTKDPTLPEGRDGDRGVWLTGPRDRGHPQGLRRARQRPARRDMEHLLSGRVPRRPRRLEAASEARAEDEAEGREAGAADADRADYDDAADDDDSALATASANQEGMRVGRRVTASTVACEVEPSATSSPARSTAYS